VVGPGQKGLADLRKEWLAWLDKRKKGIEAAATPEEAAERARETDTSVPNLSSLMLYVQERGEGGPTLLLPGDGRGDHLLAGLEEAGLLKDGRIHVSLLKLPHHGSSRNLSAEFFERVTADRYLISADGRYDNPDAQALQWLAEAARKQDRAYTLIATNDCAPTKEFRQKFNRSKYRYTWVCLPKRQHALTVPLHN
jgi:hypothetical protein